MCCVKRVLRVMNKFVLFVLQISVHIYPRHVCLPPVLRVKCLEMIECQLIEQFLLKPNANFACLNWENCLKKKIVHCAHKQIKLLKKFVKEKLLVCGSHVVK